MIKLISGPCSAESESQVMSTAKALKEIDCPGNGFEMTAFRAGLWKPRTRPGMFEGVGEAGIPWLVRVQKELGMKIIVEVATPFHVESVLKAGIDMVWIGARTVSDPFAVQFVADALKGTPVPVYVKNPVSPDLNLWLGAIERLRLSGVKDVVAVHRGFPSYERCRYRNMPKWQLAVDLMQRMPDVPVFCDPSHIAGDSTLVGEVSQTAVDIGFDGLFIESHYSPDRALSDAQQQLSPESLRKMLESLILKSAASCDDASGVLKGLRTDIDMIDDSLLDLLSRRMGVVDKIGEYKKAYGLTVLQQGRWEDVQRRVRRRAIERGLDEEFALDLFKVIHQASIERQSGKN